MILGGFTRMLRCFPVAIFFCLLTFALLQPRTFAQLQPTTPASDSTGTTDTAKAKVAPDAAVITIHGLCGNVFLPGTGPDTTGQQSTGGASDAAALTTPNPSCQTIITREEFENLLKGMSPRVDPRTARSFAKSYPESLILARKAVETGLDKQPDIEALLQFKYQQALYSVYKAHVKKTVNEMSDADVEKFYNANRERYEEFGLLRIHVPNVKEHHPAPGAAQPAVNPAAEEAEMKDLATRIRAEAVAGGNFDKLQAKVYKLAGSVDDPPDTDLGDKWTRDTLPEEDSAVLKLKPGQVSEPIHNENGWNIVKVVSRKTPPLSEARDITIQMIVADQANSIRHAITTDINEQYFVHPVARDPEEPLK
jgi:peptidyl-prolyl cis-trans isomerase C